MQQVLLLLHIKQSLVENGLNIIGGGKLRCQDTNTTLEGINIYKEEKKKKNIYIYIYIRESVDSLCRDGLNIIGGGKLRCQDTNTTLEGINIYKEEKKKKKKYIYIYIYIRESVDSLCRDGADTQYMQYLSKSRITSPQTQKKLI